LDAEAERLERAIAELAPAHDVTAFAESRRASDDYRQHLGGVSLLRRDLETFAAILDRERKTGGLERIVLYVDDLDRCPPDVVVVGVDARWLRQAIQRHYATMLPDDSVTPVRYLEKIFQIPFQLSIMDNEGFADLIRDLVAPQEGEPAIEVVLPREVLADSADPLVTEQAREQVDQALERIGVAPPPLNLRPRQLEIPAEELDFLTRLAPLVPSPRAAKRLVNLYRLVRTRLAGAELGATPAVAALLAVHANDATAACALLDRIATTELTSWRKLLNEGAQDRDVAALCARLTGIEGLPDELTIYQRWLPLIRRFSFGH
jgi:hypothetical protein